MKLKSNKSLTAALALATLFSADAVSLYAQGAAATSTAPKMAKAAPKPAPTASEIADATTKGMVWVNLNTKVYHKSGTDFYGKTKNGQFMAEADAQKAGYKAAQEPQPKKVKAPKAASAMTAAPAPK